MDYMTTKIKVTDNKIHIIFAIHTLLSSQNMLMSISINYLLITKYASDNT